MDLPEDGFINNSHVLLVLAPWGINPRKPKSDSLCIACACLETGKCYWVPEHTLVRVHERLIITDESFEEGEGDA
jgi:hypothetical protein